MALVVDDGSVDGTARAAAEAGARVLSLGGRVGLGAAVRAGLAEALNLGAAVVAFCDADGEYSPEELDRLVAPILDGRADYVVGSRFAGRIGRMTRWRRTGNRVLTAALRALAGEPITDGQSGYRALSRHAAAAAEVIHDYNYAQVLTLDLLQKGFGYAEVPITYSFRTTGRSFVRLVPYLRRVVPAVVRQLCAPRTAGRSCKGHRCLIRPTSQGSISIPAGPGGGVEKRSEEGAWAPSLVGLIATTGPATDAPDEGSGPAPAETGPVCST